MSTSSPVYLKNLSSIRLEQDSQPKKGSLRARNVTPLTKISIPQNRVVEIWSPNDDSEITSPTEQAETPRLTRQYSLEAALKPQNSDFFLDHQIEPPPITLPTVFEKPVLSEQKPPCLPPTPEPNEVPVQQASTPKIVKEKFDNSDRLDQFVSENKTSGDGQRDNTCIRSCDCIIL